MEMEIDDDIEVIWLEDRKGAMGRDEGPEGTACCSSSSFRSGECSADLFLPLVLFLSL
jgi:hypothetical protein